MYASPVRRLRQAAGLTQAELAYQAGVNPRLIRKLEAYETKAGNLTLQNALLISAALGVDPVELVPGKQVASMQREAGEAEPESRPESRRYKKYIECQKCGNSMSFPEWEQHRFRCPICGEQA